MKKILFVSILLGLLLGCQPVARRVNYLPKLTQEPVDIDLTSLEEKYGKYPAVYLDRSQDLEHVVTSGSSSGWEYLDMRHHLYVVLDPDSEEMTTFKVYLEKDWDLVTANMQIMRPDGTRDVYGIDDLRMEEASRGRRAYKFAYPKVSKGCVIEEQLEIRASLFSGRPPLYQDIPLQFRIPCLSASFSFAFPDWWQMRIKNIGPDRTIETQTDRRPDDHKVIVTYQQTDIPAIEDEPFSPFFKEVAEYLEFEITDFSLGSFYYNAPSTWEAFARSFKSLVMDKDANFSSRVQRTTEDLVKDCDSPFERFDTIVTFVQEEISTDSGGKTGNFARVLRDKKGDPFTNTALTQKMLAKVGLSSRFILIHSAQDGYFDRNFVSQRQLYLPALLCSIEDRDYVVFPYIKGLPVEHIPAPFQGQDALAISIMGVIDFIKTPRGNYFENAADEVFDLTIAQDGAITVKEKKVLFGSEAYWVRSMLKDLKEDEKEEILEMLMTYSDGEVKNLNHRFENPEHSKKPLEIHLEYEIDNLVTIMPDEILFQTGGLFTPTAKIKTKVNPDERQNPIAIHYDSDRRKQINIRYPQEWRLIQGPGEISKSNFFGSIEADTSTSPGTLEVDVRFHLNRCQEPKERFGELLEIAGTEVFKDWDTFVFEPI